MGFAERPSGSIAEGVPVSQCFGSRSARDRVSLGLNISQRRRIRGLERFVLLVYEMHRVRVTEDRG